MLKALTLSLVGMEAVDGYFTLWAVTHGYTEANPLWAPVAGIWYAPLIGKILPAAVVGYLLYRLAGRYPRLKPVVVFGMFAAVGFLLWITAGNIGELN